MVWDLLWRFPKEVVPLVCVGKKKWNVDMGNMLDESGEHGGTGAWLGVCGRQKVRADDKWSAARRSAKQSEMVGQEEELQKPWRKSLKLRG